MNIFMVGNEADAFRRKTRSNILDGAISLLEAFFFEEPYFSFKQP